MIRVYYQHPNPAGGWFAAEHSTPVADMAQWELRVEKFAAEYGIVGVRVVRVEQIEQRPPTKGEEEFYERWGTAGEF